ncbi:hypothetical protein BT69DRAFT_1255212 [Atractiella rhizophila]|nr:hypothetical protein BT69DRAFT_1255212 [Atractiella rhizophila]
MSDLGSMDRDKSVLRSTWVLKLMLSKGYTTVRDVGGATKAHADATAEWLIPGPRIFQGGSSISQTGGHGDGGDPYANNAGCCAGGRTGGIAVVADGVDACLREARTHMRQGADHIKVHTSGGVGSVTDKLEGTQFTIPELQAISTTVKNMGGRLVTAHCYTSAGIRHALAGGLGGIEHGNLVDEPTAALMAEAGMFLTPTLAVHQIMGNPPFDKMLHPRSKEKNKIVKEQGLIGIQNAEKAGVIVGLGSDMVGPTHPYLTQEFVVRSKVLSSPTILKQATINGAKIVGLEGKIGQLTEGAFADILVLAANPLEDVTIFDRTDENVLAVLKEGRCVRSAVEGLKAEVTL